MGDNFDEDKEAARLLKDRQKAGGPAKPAQTSTKPTIGGGNPKCARCGKTVYHNEKSVACGKDWHTSCLKCKSCNKRLDATTLTEHDDEIFCKVCYGRNFGPKGVGFGLGGSLTSDARDVNIPVEKDPKPQGTVSTADADTPSAKNFCPNCGDPAAGKKFCSNCGTKLQ
eukprot:TRINITY_DN3666_c0_g1_i1.p1 TRINITY_DN3666_c0_g1~~TRINITY_DN3666_c0_g1_i1.p1  ORF type:complete len:169 (+),score=39.72 TRINITY_DN3666_c0_g1_i1:169-675(+)